jgi:RHS repeat-associated protein
MAPRQTSAQRWLTKRHIQTVRRETPTPRNWLLVAAILIIAVSLQGTAYADGASCKIKTVRIGFRANILSDTTNGVVTLNGSSVVGAATDCDSFDATADAFTDLLPYRPYTLSSAGELCDFNVNFFSVPEDYAIYVDGVEKRTIDGIGTGTWTIVLKRKCPCEGESKEVASSPNTNVGSVNFSVSMGTLSDARGAESIRLQEESLSAPSYTPAALLYSPPGLTNDIDVVRNGDGSLRQVKAPEALADIVVISGSEYDIRFYRPADVGAKDGNGIYAVSGQPFAVWKIKNPDPATTTRLQISKTQGGSTDIRDYVWDPSIDSWSLTTGGGARIETRTNTYPTVSSRVEVHVIKDNTGQTVSKTARTYHMYPWGEELIREVVDPDAAALTTIYAYFEGQTDPVHYSRLQSISYPDGSWEKYDYDADGNRIMVMRPWKDLSMSSATEANSYVTRSYFSAFDGIVTLPYARNLERVEQQIAGVTVRKTTYARSGASLGGEPAVTEVQTSYSSAANTEVISTTTYYLTASTFLANRMALSDSPVGTRDTYTYEKGTYTPNADPSLSTFTPDVNGVAQRETVIHGTTASPAGVAFKTTKETAVRDQFGRTVLQEAYVYNGTDYERFGWTATDYDDRGHVLQTRDHKGQVTSAVWDGDLKSSDTDAAGIKTDYTYDALNRISTQTKKGVAASGPYPAQPDIITTFTYDSEGRQIGESLSGGSLTLTKSTAYDVAGRIKKETDNAGLSTTRSYVNGGRTETVTVPGGATKTTDKYLDGQTKSVTGSSVVAKYFDYGINADGTRYTQEFTGSQGLSSPRWTKTTNDWLGRAISVEKPSFTGTNAVRTSAYNNKGQLISETIVAGATKLLADRLYEYDDLGNQIRNGLDVDATGALVLLSTDRISETDVAYEKVGTDWFRTTSSKSYLTDNNDTPIIQLQRERLNNFSLNGAEQTISEITLTDVAGNTTKTTNSIDRAAKKIITTTDTPDSDVNALSVAVNGLLQSSTPATPQTATTFGYDALGRQASVSDPRTGTTTQGYSSTTGQLISTNDGAGTTTYEYYAATHVSAGRLKSQTNAAGKKVYFNYNARGETVQTWGDTTYPLEYVFDSYGQKTEMHTFRGGGGWISNSWPSTSTGTADVTKWIYQDSTGMVTLKQDAVLKGTGYTYDEMGRIKTRTWARGIVCTYNYDPNTGAMSGLSYSDSTPAVTFAYDRGGRQKTVTDAAGTHARSFNLAGEMQDEQITGGILDGVGVNVGYDGFLRRNSLQSLQGANTLSAQTYGYDSTSRLQTITSGSQTATYAYYPNSGLLNTTTFTSGTQTSRNYDSISRLQTISTATPAAGIVAGYTYTYNNLSQRIKVTREDGSYWSYVYNDRGELISGKKYWADNTPVWGAQTENSYDNLGNRTAAKSGGNQLNQLRQGGYTANSLNQYTQRTNPGEVDVTGAANVAATVSVNDQETARKGDYFYKELVINNTTGPVYQQVTVVGARQNFGAGGEDAVTQEGGHVFVPQAVESFTYDFDGNPTSDGRWDYTWDAENRLTSMVAIPTVPAEAKQRFEFAYDATARRIQKKVYAWDIPTSTYQLQSTTKFVYDGWNLVAELDGNNAITRTYTWALGKLHLINEAGNMYSVANDGIGNVAALVTITGSVAAAYDYGPFGETLKASGNYATLNPFRFSTKYTDRESGLIDYGYRFYNPSIGRWVSRDPSEERGGTNLYALADNDPLNYADPVGLSKVKVTAAAFIPWDWVEFPDPNILNPVRGYVHGDGRGPGDPWSGKYRLMNWIDFDVLEKNMKDPDSQGTKFADNSSSTRQIRVGSHVIDSFTSKGSFTHTTKATRKGSCTVEVELTMSGGVPWLVGGPQPPIDYSYTISVTEFPGGKISAQIRASHDGFPGHELYVEASSIVKFGKSYMPTWFASEPPGQTAHPDVLQAIKAREALAGRYKHQDWLASAKF